MTTYEILIGGLIFAALSFIIWLQLKKPKLDPSARDWKSEFIRIEAELKSTDKKLETESQRAAQLEKDLQKTIGNRDALVQSQAVAKAELEAERKNITKLDAEIAKFAAEKEQKFKEHQVGIDKINQADQALKDERGRVLESEKAKKEKSEQERDRLWNDHEVNVVSWITDLCKQPSFSFTCFSNTTLPQEDFIGKFKPDVVISFLNQYVIFDAKVSKAENLNTYIQDQVKSTASKIEAAQMGSKIYPHIFLVVPTEAIAQLPKLHHIQGDYTFYIVSKESIAPILSLLKRITTYDLAESIDPQKREKFIHNLADLVSHIRYRNAHDLLLVEKGIEVLLNVKERDPELAHEVEEKTKDKKTVLKPTDIKRLASSMEVQKEDAASLKQPIAPVPSTEITEAVTDQSVRYPQQFASGSESKDKSITPHATDPKTHGA